MSYMLIFIVLRVAVSYTVMQLFPEMFAFEKGDIPFYLPQKIFPEVSVEEFLPN